MHLTHVAVGAAVTLSVAAISYSQLDPGAAAEQAQTVADRATCRTVDTAILAYAGVNGDAPDSVAALSGYVDGDITAYRIVAGRAAGPGCATP
ncbi:hypothetical protein [Actinoplanes solisilvae]|uniref:hypothetical protein n=1 Tax=Actinoplanes solisilvae TaxID=2486853 RepID=UPI000FDB7213|nr:hypothetical protein [Actinoplanes solisilvae]